MNASVEVRRKMKTAKGKMSDGITLTLKLDSWTSAKKTLACLTPSGEHSRPIRTSRRTRRKDIVACVWRCIWLSVIGLIGYKIKRA